MGLNTTHGAWDASYSTFQEWREWLANKAGFKLRNNMVGFGGDTEWDESADYYPLLSHSDCDGELTPLECSRTVKFLSSITEKKPTDKDLSFAEKFQYQRCERFIKGCEKAIENKQSILFQ